MVKGIGLSGKHSSTSRQTLLQPSIAYSIHVILVYVCLQVVLRLADFSNALRISRFYLLRTKGITRLLAGEAAEIPHGGAAVAHAAALAAFSSVFFAELSTVAASTGSVVAIETCTMSCHCQAGSADPLLCVVNTPA